MLPYSRKKWFGARSVAAAKAAVRNELRLALGGSRASVRPIVILMAPQPDTRRSAVPTSLSEEAGRLMSQHKAVRVAITPEDEAVSVEEAAALLGVEQELVREMLKVRVLKSIERGGECLVCLDSLLAFRRSCASPGPLDKTAALLGEELVA